MTIVRELREFTRDPDANPSGLEPADIVATENRPCGNMVCLPIISPVQPSCCCTGYCSMLREIPAADWSRPCRSGVVVASCLLQLRRQMLTSKTAHIAWSTADKGFWLGPFTRSAFSISTVEARAYPALKSAVSSWK